MIQLFSELSFVSRRGLTVHTDLEFLPVVEFKCSFNSRSIVKLKKKFIKCQKRSIATSNQSGSIMKSIQNGFSLASP